MIIFKRCVLVLLLLSSQCFAKTAVTGDRYYLYYVASTNNDTHLYYGKAILGGFGTAFVEFDQLAEVKSNNCSGTATRLLTCKINKFLQADKNNRAELVEVLVNKPTMFSDTPLVAIRLD